MAVSTAAADVTSDSIVGVLFHRPIPLAQKEGSQMALDLDDPDQCLAHSAGDTLQSLKSKVARRTRGNTTPR
jgi:hypothetical protein